MPTIRRDPTQSHTLTPREREWIRRQGHAAREQEARQRRALRERRPARRPAGGAADR
jgi:hypothetical protein